MEVIVRDGKISESVLMRSVLRKIKTKREEVVCGAGIGVDCAVLSFGEGEETVLSTNPVCAPADMVCVYGMHRALNNIAAAGAEPVGILISAMLPADTEEPALQNMMAQAEEICRQYHVQLSGGHTELTETVIQPVLTVTGIGKRKKADTDMRRIKPGQDVIVSKWIGLEGTVRTAREYRAALLTRYPSRMIDEAAGFERFLSIIPEAATARKSGVCGIHDVSQGGIFGALWEMANGAGVGLEIDLKKLPVRQETIEICEFYDLNPYELSSGGCLLMTTEDGNGLAAALEREGIPAVVVGKTTAGNDRVLFNEEERRFLEPPKTDQFYKLTKV
ncbi:MAG: hydrogenase maturation factor [Lachnospiraceae bacterium]|nr:hydrogenase maturation factor [Lachnospiraceae bacterium]